MSTEIHAGLMISTLMITDQLTDEELSVAYMAATAGWDINNDLLGYEKLVPLLTQNNGKRMHSATIEALGVIAGKRLGG